jgi:hypothetical protein
LRRQKSKIAAIRRPHLAQPPLAGRLVQAAASAAAAALASASGVQPGPAAGRPAPVFGSWIGLPGAPPLAPPDEPPLPPPDEPPLPPHWPLGQPQTPSKQVSPAGQALPQAPQLALSQQVATQTPSQLTSPSAQQSPLGQSQTPSKQVVPAGQTLPQAPQCWLSQQVSTQVPPQSA